MKKFLIILTVLMLAASTVLIAACNKKPSDEANVSEEWSEEESSSSGNKTRLSSDPSEPNSSDGGNVGASTGGNTPGSTNSAESSSSGGGTKPTPDLDGDVFYVDSVVVPDDPDLSIELWVYLSDLNNIGAITAANYKEKREIIEEAIRNYDSFSAREKQYVTNIDSLRAALDFCDEFVRKEVLAIFNARYAELPEASALKNKDVELVNQLSAYTSTGYEHYSYLASHVEDFLAKKAKIEACATRVREAMVETAVIIQDANENGILEDVIEWSGKANNGTETMLGSGSGMSLNRKRTSLGSFFSFGSWSISTASSIAENVSVAYTDKKNPNTIRIAMHCQVQKIEFTATSPGTLTFYLRKERNYTYTTTLKGEVVDEFIQDKSNTTDEHNTHQVQISGTGTVLVTANNSTFYIYAVKYSYPNLGD